MELDRISDWLWCLRTPIVQAYAVRERDGFNLIDTCTAGLGWEHAPTIITSPGHTPGHISVLFERERVLVAGDALASHELGPMVGVFNADPAGAAATARRLATLEIEVACFGHGEPLRHDAAAQLREALTPH